MNTVNEKTHYFWNDKPMATIQKKDVKNKTENVKNVAGYDQPSIPNSLYWDVVRIDDDNNTEKIKEFTQFIQDHYNEKGYHFQIYYSYNHLLFELRNTDSCIVLLRNKNNHKIVASIMGTIRNYVLKIDSLFDDFSNTLLINFLCVHHTCRNLRLAPKMITEISRIFIITHRVTKAYYISTTELPVPFSKSNYYHRILNLERCILAKYYKESTPKEHDRLSRIKPIEKRLYRTEWCDEQVSYNQEICDKIVTIVNNYYAKNKELYEPITIDIVKHMLQYTECIDSCVIYKNDTLVGYLAVLKHPYKILVESDFVTDDRLKTVLLYHFGVIESEDPVSVLNDVIASVMELKRWDVFSVTDHTITDSVYIEGHAYYHYMYNVKMPLLKPENVCVMGI